MRSLRIAIVTEFYYPHLGGVTEHVQNFATELLRLGHAPFILTPRVSGTHVDAPIVRRVGKSVVVPSNGSFARIAVGWGLRRRVREILRSERIDLVHVHGGLAPTLGLVAPEAADDLGIPVVLTFHSWFRRSVAYAFLRAMLQKRLDRAAAKIAVSRTTVDALSRYFHADWQVIPNGVNTAYFHKNGRRPEDAETCGPKLLFLARLDPRNGLETVLSAMPKIAARYPRAELTIAGSGPLRGYYERIAKPLGKHVRFLGRVYDERAEQYATSDIFLCPTEKASFGITLLEAMASGTPIIASDVTGFREIASDGCETLLVPPRAPDAWAEATIGLLEDPSRRSDMGNAGLVKAARYSWASVTSRVLEVYRSVLS
jgi:phosphatidyl-myo-inositol alpha-mannosyltransferase